MSSMLPFDPKKPLFGFTARFPHAKRRVHVFTDGRFAYFRPKNAPPDWWSATMEDVPRFKESLVEQKRWQHGVPNISKYEIWRVFFLPDPRPTETRLWEIAWCYAGGRVTPVGHQAGLQGAYFRSPETDGSSLIRSPTSQLREQFKRFWNDPLSDVRAALDWCDLSAEERQWRSIVWLCGGRDEVGRVSHAACILEMEEGWQQGQSLRLGISVYHSSICSTGIVMGAEAWHSGWRASSEDRITHIFRRLEERNQARFDYPAGSRDEETFAWSPPTDPTYGNAEIEIEIAPPTQHERLEASLFLRDWLRQNAPDLLSDWFPDAT